MNKAAAQIFIN